MLSLAALAALASPTYAHAVPWALNFAAPGDFCMVGDIDGDGSADLIRVSPAGDSFIDVARNGDGMKCIQPQRANSNWGKNCEAAGAGEFDATRGVDVAGLFDGDTIRLARDFKDGHFVDVPDWIKLPKKLTKPHMASFEGGDGRSSSILVWSETTGDGFVFSTPAPSSGPKFSSLRLARGTSWIGTASGTSWMDSGGTVYRSDGRRREMLGRMLKGRNPLLLKDGKVLVDKPAIGDAVEFPACPLPESPCAWAQGDLSRDGREDLVQFRFGPEAHSGNDVLLYRQIPASEEGARASGTAAAGAAAPFAESSDDGLLDDWKLNGFRGLDLKALGCKPGQRDIIVLISRYANADEKMVQDTFKTIEGYYLSLGWHLHPIFLDPLGDADQKLPWWQLRDKYLPDKWRGVVHWMAVTPYGGGQADELSDGGICGGNGWSLYATFIHEFGHQLGLNHEGFFPTTGCPIYSSMMNYPYSYTYEGSIKNIHYSNGALAKYVLHETDLDETIPLPYDQVKFLADAPYHYRLKANGKTTLIDWNWDGKFGEKHVRADINYAYSTSAGRRDKVDKTQGAPWTFTDGKTAYVLYGQEGVKADGKSDPSIGPDKPGWLLLRRLIKPFQWTEPIKVVDGGVTGDAVAIAYRGEIAVAYPSDKGLAMRWLKLRGDKVVANDPILIDATASAPSLGVYRGKLYLWEWDPKTGQVSYRVLGSRRHFGDPIPLRESGPGGPVHSKEPVSMAVDTMKNEVLLGLTEAQDDKRPMRWCIRRYGLSKGLLSPVADPAVANSEREWIGGAGGSAQGSSRCVLLFDSTGATGMKGRIVFYELGGISANAPWACIYVAQSIADKSVGGGWMIKRYYDEWTQSRSGPAACWYGGDILYAYRWVDASQGDGDNLLHVGYNGTGIETAPMGDFDDIDYIKDFGMQNCILYMRQ